MKKNALWFTLLSLGCSGAHPETDELQGVVELHQRVLAFQVPGRLSTLSVKRGQSVKAGEVLARLDDALDRPGRDAQAADVAAAEAQLDLLHAGARGEDIRTVEAQLRGAKAQESTLTETVRRTRELRAAGAATPQQLDDAEGALSRATAEREADEQRLASIRAGARSQDVRTAQARLDAAKAALALADARLAEHLLHAPIDGTIEDTHAEPGEILGAGGAVATLSETARPYVDLYVPMPRAGAVRVGQGVALHVDTEPTRSIEGTVEDVGERTEFTPRFLFSPKERPNLVVRVRVALRDPDGRLRAGVPIMGNLAGAAP